MKDAAVRIDSTHQVEPERFTSLDRDFVEVVDGAFADAAVRSGSHLLCQAGCHSCCVGVFAIGPADSLRLRRGLTALAEEHPEQASRIRQRAAASRSRLSSTFPGDPETGVLDITTEEAAQAFADYGNDEVCPALDPVAGTCDLYAARPHTCRVYGPPVSTPEGYGVCELCFTHATGPEVAAAAMAPEPEGLAEELDEAAQGEGAPSGETIIAWVLLQSLA